MVEVCSFHAFTVQYGPQGFAELYRWREACTIVYYCREREWNWQFKRSELLEWSDSRGESLRSHPSLELATVTAGLSLVDLSVLLLATDRHRFGQTSLFKMD